MPSLYTDAAGVPSPRLRGEGERVIPDQASASRPPTRRCSSRWAARPRRPDQLTWLWRSACKSLKLPMVSFHALRHTHASALIAAGLDVVLIARRLGHGSPHVTLGVYGHLFKRDDTAAARAIEAAMTRRRSEPNAP